MAGRPSDYTQEVADFICEQLTNGLSLRRICSAEAMPNRTTVFRWLEQNEEFAAKYAHAREIQADAIEDDIAHIEELTLDGEIDPKAARAVINSKQWRAAKLRPKKYGDFKAVELTGANGGPVVIQATTADERL